MKKIILPFLFSLLGSSAFAAQDYLLDPQHTYVLWHADHFGFSSPSGKWMAEGTLKLDNEHPQNSQVNVKINVADLTTGIPELDKHLKGKLFLDAEQFPTATFVSNKVELNNNTITKVHGTVTLHGVSKPLTLEVHPNKSGVNPLNNKETAGFTAYGQLKRSDFGINTLLPGVSDEVKLEVQVEASKQ